MRSAQRFLCAPQISSVPSLLSAQIKHINTQYAALNDVHKFFAFSRNFSIPTIHLTNAELSDRKRGKGN
jgi:hypothetical protein